MKQALPVSIPDGWRSEATPAGGVAIEAFDPKSGAFLGAVSVDETKTPDAFVHKKRISPPPQGLTPGAD